MKKIELIIDTNGETQIKVTGVKGEACKDLTKGLERALGNVKSDRPTAEMKGAEIKTHLDAGA